MNHRDFAIDLAKQAGTIIRQNFTLGMKKEWKGDDTPLTVTDTAINQLVIDKVKQVFPDHGIISEEGSDYTKQEYAWICDPVDGTIPFSHGIPTCCFLLALARNGEVILGVVYDPFMERMFVAERGKGTTLNGMPVYVSKTSSLQNGYLGLEAWKIVKKYDIIDALKILENRGALVTRFASYGYQCSLVASGESVAAVFSGDKPWDSAAPGIIVEEAGGRISDLFGLRPRFDQPTRGFIASNGLVHDELLSVIRAFLPKA